MCNRLQMKIIQGPRLNLRHLILFDIGELLGGDQLARFGVYREYE